MAEYLRGIIDQYGKTHITLERCLVGALINRYIEELIEACWRGKDIVDLATIKLIYREGNHRTFH